MEILYKEVLDSVKQKLNAALEESLIKRFSQATVNNILTKLTRKEVLDSYQRLCSSIRNDIEKIKEEFEDLGKTIFSVEETIKFLINEQGDAILFPLPEGFKVTVDGYASYQDHLKARLIEVTTSLQALSSELRRMKYRLQNDDPIIVNDKYPDIKIYYTESEVENISLADLYKLLKMLKNTHSEVSQVLNNQIAFQALYSSLKNFQDAISKALEQPDTILDAFGAIRNIELENEYNTSQLKQLISAMDTDLIYIQDILKQETE